MLGCARDLCLKERVWWIVRFGAYVSARVRSSVKKTNWICLLKVCVTDSKRVVCVYLTFRTIHNRLL